LGEGAPQCIIKKRNYIDKLAPLKLCFKDGNYNFVILPTAPGTCAIMRVSEGNSPPEIQREEEKLP
jgi:hypothetical protein